jgi:hypothetical protein
MHHLDSFLTMQLDLGFFEVVGETTEGWRFGEGRGNGAERKQSSDEALSLEALSL